MFASTPSTSMSLTRACGSKLTRSLGNGGPCQRTSHGVPPSFGPRVAADEDATRSREPSRRFNSGRLPTRYRDMPPLAGARWTSGPTAASLARAAAERYASMGSTGSMMWVSASKMR